MSSNNVELLKDKIATLLAVAAIAIGSATIIHRIFNASREEPIKEALYEAMVIRIQMERRRNMEITSEGLIKVKISEDNEVKEYSLKGELPGYSDLEEFIKLVGHQRIHKDVALMALGKMAGAISRGG